MTKTKKIIILIIKSTLAIVVLLTLVLFFYAAFFYESFPVEQNIVEDKIEEKKLEESLLKQDISKSKVKQKSDVEQKKIKIEKPKISDSLFMTIGAKPVTQSDVINEIKIILILTNESYAVEKRNRLQEAAAKSIIMRNVKQIELEKHNYFKFDQEDLKNQLQKLASDVNLDLETLKNVFASNEINFSLVEDQMRVELFWNSLIFQLYKNRIIINQEEIEKKLKSKQKNRIVKEYLISEILIKVADKNNPEEEFKKLKNKIKIEGFEKVAKSLSIIESAKRGGDLGWLDENIISEKVKTTIVNTPIGNLSKPILLPEGILIFKIRDKRNIKKNINLEELKEKLVNDEKNKMLRMYSLSHYDKLRRSASIKFFND